MRRSRGGGRQIPRGVRSGEAAVEWGAAALARYLRRLWPVISPGVVLCFVAASSQGCMREPPENAIENAEALIADLRWDEAIVALKHHLFEHPNDAGAHFYLGRCYINVESVSPMLIFAEGELETALDLFKRRGEPNTIARFSDTYFELICHIERAKVCLKQLNVVLSQSFQNPETPRNLCEAILNKCELGLEAARAVEPTSADVRDLEQIIREARRQLGLHPGRHRPRPARSIPNSVAALPAPAAWIASSRRAS